MRIGLFINYAPAVDLRKEGLGRYLGDLIRAFYVAGHQVSVAAPKWLKKNVNDLLDDINMPSDAIQMITTRRRPLLVVLLQRLSRPKKKIKRIRIDFLWKHLQLEAERMGSAAGAAQVFVEILRLFLLIILALLLTPILFVGYVTVVVIRHIKKCALWCANRLNKKINPFAIYHAAFRKSAKDLVHIINNCNVADVWYIPTSFWPEACNIRHPLVINLPDIETEVFPETFVNMGADILGTDAIRETIHKGALFVTYCDTVKDRVLHGQYGASEKKVFTIRHMNHDLLPYIRIDPFVARQMNIDDDMIERFSRLTVNHISQDGIQIGDAKYLFFASQVRSNKNILFLLRAYNELIHHRFRHEKLVLTGAIDKEQEIWAYVEEHGLMGEVLVASGVTTQQLAALYRCATLVVNPTLYEGGFPFTFSEGMSVGTPSIMSDIPQVRELVTKDMADMLFEPDDFLNLADKIEWALDHLEELYRLELPLYEKIAERTPQVVADEFVRVFQEAILSWDGTKTGENERSLA